MTRKNLRIAVLALPESSASTIFGMRDIFCSVGRDWGMLLEGRPGESPVDCFIAARSARGFRVSNDTWIRPDRSLADVGRCDLVCVPDLAIPPGASIRASARDEIAWVAEQYRTGATVAAACSGALLLGDAGLLDGVDVTTHWAYCDALHSAHPTARLHPSRVVVSSGEGGRIITAGGGFSWLDLAVLLVARFFGEEEAMRQARIHLIDWHGKAQLAFADLSRTRQIDDALIAEHQAWLADHYTERSPVAALTHWSALSERSLKRRFSQATGMTPIEYVQTLRLEDAKRRLETSDTPVEEVAIDVGYEDASFFRRLFRRRVGLSPHEYRKRFGALRRSLRGPEPQRGA
jgi:transcriptional regulator GlxA family with amidase domain